MSLISLSRAEQDELARRAQAGDKSARDELIEAHRSYARALAEKYIAPDLVEDALREAMEAIRMGYDSVGFDWTCGYKFETWCRPFITQGLNAFHQRISGRVLFKHQNQRANADEACPSEDPANAAKRGDLDALVALEAAKDAKGARNAYKWLCASADFGHVRAMNEIADLMEWSDLRHDDDQYETAGAHWELGVAYLEGADGLPRDLELARKHLQATFLLHQSLEQICRGTGETYSAEDILRRVDDEARAVLQAALSRRASSS
jgi:hypothetical protein